MTERRDSVFPHLDEAPVSSRGKDSREFLARLASTTNAPDFVPGTAMPPRVEDNAEGDSALFALAEEVHYFSESEPSLAAQARALAVSSLLWRQGGDSERAGAAAAAAAARAPKLASVAAEFRAHVDESLDVDAWQKQLEATTRLAAHPSSRNHTALLLARSLLRHGSAERASALLDHTHRSGTFDARVGLMRILLRLAAGQSTSGIEAAPGLAEAALRVAELLGGRDAETGAEHLLPLRAARRLERGEISAAATVLAGLDEPSSRALAAALWALDPERDTAQLWDQADASGAEVDVARARAISSKDLDGPTLQRLPTVERAVLRALRSGPSLDSAASAASPDATEASESAASLGDRQRYLALGSLGEPDGRVVDGLEPAGIDDVTLGAARLGASLLRVGTPDFQVDGLPLGPDDELLRSLLQIDFARAGGDTDSVSSKLDALATSQPRVGAQFLAALLREKAGRESAADFRLLLDDPSFASAALRALAQSGDTNFTPLLEERAKQQGHGESRADLRLEWALRTAGAERAAALEVSAADWEEPGIALGAALSSLADPVDEAARARAFERLEASADPWFEHMARTFAALDLAGSDPQRAARALEQVADGVSHPLGLLRTSELLEGRAPDRSARALGRASLWYNADRAASAALGDGKSFVEELASLLELAPDTLAKGLDEQLADAPGQATRRSERLLAEAREGSEGARLYALGQLAELDERRGDLGSALLWRRSAVEAAPTALQPLLALEAALFRQGRTDEWAQVRDRLTRLLPPEDRGAHALLAASAALGQLDVRDARAKLEPLGSGDDAPLLAKRLSFSAAIERGDDTLIASGAESLARAASSDLDRAALLLEASYAHLRNEQPVDARRVGEEALAVRPDLFPTRLLMAHLVAEESPREQAQALSELAEHSHVALHRAAWLVDAARLWRSVGDEEPASAALRAALDAEPNDEAAFHELSELYLDGERFPELARLIETRLVRTDDAKERVELELRLAELEIALDRRPAARDALQRALALAPRNGRILRAHAQLCSEDGDYKPAEASLVTLLSLLDDGREKAAVQRTLGLIYDDHLEDLEKAMDAYEATLLRHPQDREIEVRLVSVFARLGFGERATSLQTKLIQSAATEDEKRRGALQLASLYEGVGRDADRASATLERALKAWPLDAEVLDQAAGFMERRGDATGRAILVDRVKKEAERTLHQGRLEAGLFDTLSRAARLGGIPGQADAAFAARAAFLGEASPLAGAGITALDPTFEDGLAPPILSAPLLRLLRRTGPVLDAAFPVDMAALGATRISTGPAFEQLSSWAAELKRPAPEVYLATALGSRCQALGSAPPRFLIGPGLDDLTPGARNYQLVRALEFQQLGVAALARSRPDDVWSMVAALLLLFAPNWRPRGGDARKVAQARALVEQGLARVGYDDDVPTLALEAIGALGDRGAELGEAIRTLGMRIGVFAVGDPSDALSALSAGTDKPLPDGGPARFRWFEGHPEAKELLLFSVGDEVTRAREKAGLAEQRTHRAPLPPRAMSLGPVPPRRS